MATTKAPPLQGEVIAFPAPLRPVGFAPTICDAEHVLPIIRPMPLVRIPEPFDHPEWLFELKLDGFRALAHIEGHHCRLVSRGGHVFKQWPYLCVELAHAVRCDSAILDGEVVCLNDDGRPNFHKLLFRREWPSYFAFDLLALDGSDLWQVPLMTRKRLLMGIMPTVESRIRYVDHIRGRGNDFFRLTCEQDLEGIVGKWAKGSYQTSGVTSWLKIKNPDYSQAEGRHELFERRGRKHRPGSWRPPELSLV
jgi:bifunctional non-homologous end joining protein LigD